jgi:hypothetical protein
VPARPSGRGTFEGSKALGSEKDKVLGSGLCCERRREVEQWELLRMIGINFDTVTYRPFAK